MNRHSARRIIITAAILFYIACLAYAAITAFPIAAADAPNSAPAIFAPTPWPATHTCANTAADWHALSDDARMHAIGCDDHTGQWMPAAGRCPAMAYARYQSGIAISRANMPGCMRYEDGSWASVG
jgi:hypothetical protein